MLSFDNTEIAFKHKSDDDLRRAYFLFNMLGKRSLIKIGGPLAGPAVKFLFPARLIVKETIFKHFCGGENINDCENTIGQLAKANVKTILDYSVEGKATEADFERTAKEIMRTQEKAGSDARVAFSVFKITGLARFELLEKVSAAQELSAEEQAEWKAVHDRVLALGQKAYDLGIRVMVDAEETWIQPAIDQLIWEMIRLFNKEKAVIYTTFQMYAHESLAKLKQWTAQLKTENLHLGIKLVRGAYMEKERKRASELGYPSPIQPNKLASDRDYDLALEWIVKHIDILALCAGTHNEASSIALTQLMQAKGIDNKDERIYFSQLLGMSDHISFNLASEGYNVAKYVPYGPVKDVIPYLVRRAEENTSVSGQTGRELSLIIQERKRRKSKSYQFAKA